MESQASREATSPQVSRRALIGAGAFASTALLLGAASLPAWAASPARAVLRGPLDRPVVALTFDGGADRGYSALILDTLASNAIKATFPVTGQFAIANPDIIRRIVAEGHQLVNHSYSHPSFTGVSDSWAVISAEARRKQLEDCEAALVNAAGVGGKPYFRPPYGDYNDSVLQSLGDNGFSTCLLWSLDVYGWNGLTRSQVISRVLSNHGNGYIYLMHVGSESQEGPALQSIIDGLRNFGYSFATSADLLGDTSEPPPALFQIGDTARVTSGLYLRTEPNLTGRVMVTMPTGTLCTVLGGPSPADGYVWYQLDTPYGTGWAATVSLEKAATPPTPTVPAQPKFVVGNHVRVTDGLYLRTGPGTGTSVIVTMPTGTLGTVLAGPSPLNGYTWYQIECQYGIGWAAAEFLALSATGPTTPTPTTPTPTPTTPTPTPTQPPPTGFQAGERVRVTAGLYLRTGPGTGTQVLFTMPTGTVVTVKAGPTPLNGYTWYQVETTSATGWAAGEYLVRTTPTTPTPTPTTPGGWTAGTRVRTTANLRLRSSPSTSASIRATMPTGTSCTVVSGPQSGGGYTWYQVQSSYGTGWAASEYLVRV